MQKRKKTKSESDAKRKKDEKASERTSACKLYVQLDAASGRIFNKELNGKARGDETTKRTFAKRNRRMHTYR